MEPTLVQLTLLAIAAALMAAIIATASIAVFAGRLLRSRGDRPERDDSHDVVFVFDGPRLIDATPPARSIVDGVADDGADTFTTVCRALAPRFPELPDRLTPGDDAVRCDMVAKDGGSLLTARRDGRLLRLTLRDTETIDARERMDYGTVVAMERELDLLRESTATVTFPIWREDARGDVVWANAAYLRLAIGPEALAPVTWPYPTVFDTATVPRDGSSRRVRSQPPPSLVGHGAPPVWYEAEARAVGDETFYSAMPVDALVAAEASLRDFVQTLAKTFAHLTIGLAVFGRDRRLMMFNPALADLTTLPIDVLLSKPTLNAFLDGLRGRNMMPEPKNYKTWRDRIAALEQEAADGTYSETWHLPFGRTYRVTGRPQPDGAMALLFEDISAEIGLTRQFRTELDRSQAVFDSMQDGLAVFEPSGALTLTNAAYETLWGIEARETPVHPTVNEAARQWIADTAPTPIWGEACDFVRHETDRAEWSANARLSDGRGLTCRFVPLPGGSTLVRFTIATPKQGRTMVPTAAAQKEIDRRLEA